MLDRAAPRRIAEFICGRACAREAIRRLTGDIADLPVGPDRAPRWPGGLCGSISHSGRRAIAVAGETTHFIGIGIDLERCLSNAEARDIADLVTSDKERQRLGTRLDAVTLSLIFSAKESLFKALSSQTGPIPFFQSFQVSEIEHSNMRLSLIPDTLPGQHCETEFTVGLAELGELFATFALLAKP